MDDPLFPNIVNLINGWDMADVVFFLIILLSLIAVVIIIEVMIKKGKIKRTKTYPYKAVGQEALRWLFWTLLICLAVYFFSKSWEASLTLGVFLFACILSGFLKAMFMEYNIKKRGGEKEK